MIAGILLGIVAGVADIFVSHIWVAWVAFCMTGIYFSLFYGLEKSIYSFFWTISVSLFVILVSDEAYVLAFPMGISWKSIHVFSLKVFFCPVIFLTGASLILLFRKIGFRKEPVLRFRKKCFGGAS